MKKISLLAGIILSVGVIWTGSARYSGVQIEKHIYEALRSANQQLQRYRPATQLQLVEHSYKRGWFSSEAQIRLVLPTDAAQNNSDISRQLLFSEKISHGPFPLSQLRQFSLMPAFASIRTQLINNQVTHSLFDGAKGHSPLDAETRINYNSSTQTVLHFLPLDLDLQQQSVRYDDSKVVLNSDKQFNQISYQGKFNQFALSGVTSNHEVSTLAFKGLSFSGQSHLSDEGMRVGQQQFAAKSISLNNAAMDAFAVNDVSYQNNFDSNNNKLTGSISYHSADMIYMNQSLGRTVLQLEFANLNTTAVQQLLSTYQNGSNNTDWYQNLALALGNNAELNLKQFTMSNNKGTSQLQFQASLLPVESNPPQTINAENLIRQYLKQLSLQLSISRPMATELMSRISQGEGYSVSQAQALADSQVGQLFALAELFRLGKIHDNQLQSALTYSNDNIVFNQHKMSLTQFIQQYNPENFNLLTP